jgi:hypothetical protein
MTGREENADATALAGIRAEVAVMREALDRIEGELHSLEGRQPTAERVRPMRFYDVLVGVYEHGIHGIDGDALTRLAGQNGYQRRGLNGFFTGARAALRRSAGRVVLTPEGVRLLAVHLREVHG